MAGYTFISLAQALFTSLLLTTTFAETVDCNNAVLTKLENTDDLTSFYALFKSTGGSLGVPGPDFEERFNDNNNKLTWTILAPTNAALSKLPESFRTKLTSPEAYPLLAAVLRTHILNETRKPDELLGGSFTAIEGFQIDVSDSGAVTSNKGISGTAGTQAQVQFDGDKPSTVDASNGIIYRIDNVIDPFITFFGEDAANADSHLSPATEARDKTMRDIVFSDDNLSRAREILQVIDPMFINDRLALSYTGDREGENNQTVWLAPSNEALQLFGERAEAPGNADASKFFLESGFGKVQGGETGVVGRAGFEYMVDGDRVANARVEMRTCGKNGCVWRIGRALDTFYGPMHGGGGY